MPLSAVNMTLNGHLIHEDVRQFVELLTGVMSDQLVTIANSVIVSGLCRASQLESTSGDVLMGTSPMGMYTFGGWDIYANTNSAFYVRSAVDGHLSFGTRVSDNVTTCYGRLVTSNWDSGWANSLGGNVISSGAIHATNGFVAYNGSGYGFNTDSGAVWPGPNVGRSATVYIATHLYVFWDIEAGHHVLAPQIIETSRAAGKAERLAFSDAACLERVADPRLHVQTWATASPQKVTEPMSHTLIDAPSSTVRDPERTVGFVAEEMVEVVPEVVYSDEHGPAGIAYQNLVAVLWGAVRALDARVSYLEGEGH